MTLPAVARFVRFGRFTLDLGTDRLLEGQTPLPAPPKALAILKILVLNRDRAVTKDELLQTVWPDTIVEEANLAQQIFTPRSCSTTIRHVRSSLPRFRDWGIASSPTSRIPTQTRSLSS